jgi:hypothetical protein
MGRYYHGDIEGKFGFASQPSDDGAYFGAVAYESNYVPYVLANEDIPNAIEKLKALIKEFKKNTGCKDRLTINTKVDDFWNMVNNDWYQDRKNGLLASRIDMGLKIAQYYKAYPTLDIEFEAEF